jgi:ABC-type nitrate/sulfonate/bicarbonate transport system ATPase subunit
MKGNQAMAGPDTVLVLKDISATYSDGKALLPVLTGVSLRLEAGKFAALLGPSGSGKSTLLKIAAGLIRPDQGRVFLNGRDSTGQVQKVGYMPQQDLLFPWKTLLQNAALPLLAAGVDRNEAYGRVRELLPVFGLEGFEHYYPRRLSGGMRQRAALLRTVLIESGLLLLDEPFAALDALTREKLQEWLLSVLERFNRSVLFVTHSIDEAIYLSDRIYMLSDRPGRIILKQQIELPRPRSRSVVTSAPFLNYKQALMDSLQ